MNGETHNPMRCPEFEAVLADAIDGAVTEPVMDSLQAHAGACATCGPMFAAAQAGLHWLKALEEVEPPRNLVRNILIATSGAGEVEEQITVLRPWREKMFGWLAPVVAPVFATVRQPRVALTFAMAFFSISLLLTAAGVDIGELRRLDLRPGAVQNDLIRGYHQTTAYVMRFYDNVRFFQKFEAQVRELKNAAQSEPEQPSDKSRERKRNQDDTSGSPDRRYENYSREESTRVQAWRNAHPLKEHTLMLNRRIS